MLPQLYTKKWKNMYNSPSLSARSTVGDWIANSAGKAALSRTLTAAGSSLESIEGANRMPLSQLVPLSGGLFTDQMVADLVQEVGGTETQPDSQSGIVPGNAAAPEWEEVITPHRFRGKTVIVTGAGSGIGRATALRIAKEGGRVIAADISSERLEALVAEVPELDITAAPGDISKDDDVASIVEAAGGTIHGLANVAGIMDNMTPLHEVSDDVWERVFRVNVTGLFKLSRAIIPKMLEAKAGSIVNVASEAGLRGSSAGLAYTASKHAVVGITRSSAFMYGPHGLRINAVAPGGTITNIEASFDSEIGRERIIPLFALMPAPVEAARIAASITFLLSDDGINLNGVILPSDGGQSVM